MFVCPICGKEYKCNKCSYDKHLENHRKKNEIQKMKEEDKRMKKLNKEIEKSTKPKNVRVRRVKKKEPLNAEEMKMTEMEEKKKEDINKVRKINEEMEMMGMEDNKMKKLKTDITKRARNKYRYNDVMKELNTKAQNPVGIGFEHESDRGRQNRTEQLISAYMIKLKKAIDKIENRKGRKSQETQDKLKALKQNYQDINSGNKFAIRLANFKGIPETEKKSLKNKLLRAAGKI